MLLDYRVADFQLNSEEEGEGQVFSRSVGNLEPACREDEDLQNLEPEECSLVLQRNLDYESVRQ